MSVNRVLAGLRAGLLASVACGSMPLLAQPSSPAPAAESPPAAEPPAADAPAADAPAADAPAAAADQPSALGDVVVTARRVAENVQRVPVTVTVLTPENIERNNVTDFTNLQRIVPGYQGGARFVGNNLALNAVRMRGVPGVAYYFADVPFPIAGRSVYFDMQNLQALQGPQGTLFGEASNAGAILVTPKKPGNDFGGYVELEVGNEARKTLEGALDLPLIRDKVLLRVAGKTSYIRGFLKDIYSGHRVGREDYDLLRVVLTVRPFDGFEIETLYSSEWMRGDGVSPTTLHDFNMTANFNAGTVGTGQRTVNGMTVAEFNAARDFLLWRQKQIGPYRYQGWSSGCFATDTTPALKSKVPGPNIAAVIPNPCPVSEGTQNPRLLVNTVKWDFTDGFTLKHIFGTNWNTTVAGLFDTDLSALILRDTNTNPLNTRRIDEKLTAFRNWSSELQLVGSLLDDRLTFVTGFFNRRTGNKPVPVFAMWTTNLNDNVTRTTNKSRTKAVYGQGDFKVTDRLTATAGIRKTWDHVTQLREVLNPTTLARTSVSGGPGTPSGEGRWDSISYTAGLRYQLNRDTMFYFTHSKGHSAGGIQNVAGFERFEPDSLLNFEVGAKTTIRPTPDVLVRANASAYYGIFKDVKVASSALVPIPGTSAFNFITTTTNAGEARVTGASADVTARFWDRFQLQALAAIMDNYYTKYDSINRAGQPVDLSDTPFINTPDWKVTIAATYDLPVDEARIGTISIGADYTATPETWANIAKPIVPDNPAIPDTGAICKARRTAANGYGPLSADGGWAYKDCAPKSHNLNLRVDWRNPLGYEGLRASLVATNVTKFDGPTGIGFNYDSTGFTQFYTAQPRYLFLNLAYNF